MGLFNRKPQSAAEARDDIRAGITDYYAAKTPRQRNKAIKRAGEAQSRLFAAHDRGDRSDDTEEN